MNHHDVVVLYFAFPVVIFIQIFISSVKADEDFSCGDGLVPLDIEIQTDSYPHEISWQVIDTSVSTEIENGGPYSIPNTLHNKSICVDPVMCLEFAIYDSHSDGICCDYGEGNFKVYYMGALILEGDCFVSSATYVKFGDSCPSLFSSVSSVSSILSKPNVKPSVQPSSQPTVSFKPPFKPSISRSISKPSISEKLSARLSSKPSAETSTSSISTQGPTETKPIEFPLDKFGRRFFPVRDYSSSEKHYFAIQPPADCALVTPGCIAHPKTRYKPPSTPEWFGKLYFQPPTCVSLGHKRKCKLGHPSSRNVYPFGSRSISLEISDDDVVNLLPDQGFLPGGIAFGDINGDGHDDLVFGYNGSKNQILFNDGQNNFINPIYFGGTERTYDIALADLNNDGFIDIVEGNRYYPNYLYLNYGNGTLDRIQLPDDSPTTTATNSIALGDVDKNGHIDILVGNYGNAPHIQSSLLMLNNGDGTFEIIEFGVLKVTSVAMGDINNDNNIDLIFGGMSGPKILLNKGNVIFEDIELPLSSGYEDTTTIAVGDLNGDGWLDIACGSEDQKNFILMNKEGNTFVVVDLPNLIYETSKISIADLNGDGILDVVVGNSLGPDQVLLHRGNGLFDTYSLPGGSLRTWSLAVVSAIQPGVILIATHQQLRKSAGVIVANTFSYVDMPPGNRRNYASATGDIDENGLLDLVVSIDYSSSYSSTTTIELSLFQHDGTVRMVDIDFAVDDAVSIAIGDIDNDGHADIVVLTYFGKVTILFNNENTTFTPVKVNFPGGSGFQYISLAHVNEDRNLDIILGSFYRQNVLLANNGDGTFKYIELPGRTNSLTQTIVACDLNNDHRLDLIVGNGFDVGGSEPNQILYNTGFNTFNVTDLPGGSYYTQIIAVADLDNDGSVDIIIGNSYGQFNQILFNEGDGNFTVMELESSLRSTRDISVADINVDGLVDIVFANFNTQDQIYWNNGNRSFEKMDLQSSDTTIGSAIGDFDNDGDLDIIFTNLYHSNQLLLYNSAGNRCPDGGARLHPGSWCFTCPSYMGRPILVDQEQPMCVECMADYLLEPSSGRCNSNPCPLSHRPLGQNKCESCPSGTFYSTFARNLTNSSTWNSVRCYKCPPGHYVDGLLPAVNQCLPCNPGSYQPIDGATSCLACDKGYFQPDSGKLLCKACAVGGYCDAINICGGGFTPCPAGTYNSEKGKDDVNACVKCPIGTFGIKVGAHNVTSCMLCPPGSYTDEEGQTQCQLCNLGSFQPLTNQTSCLPCEKRTYASNPGLVECTKCPYRLNSAVGSKTCGVCDNGFYLIDESVDPADIFQKPDKYCLSCPPNAECSPNTTLETLIIPSGFWRDSRQTSTLYKCNNKACLGSSSHRKRNTEQYCIDGHTGPLCEVCVQNSHYFSTSNGGKCEECPSPWRFMIPVSISIALFSTFICLRTASKKIERYGLLSKRMTAMLLNMSIQTKFKLLVSFYQVVNTLEDVYGVVFDEKLTAWFDFLKIFNFGLIELTTIPGECLGPMKTRLILGGLWPFFVMFFVFIGLLMYIITIVRIEALRSNDTSDMRRVLWMRLLSTSIVISYLVLPSVSRSIFDAIKCQSFETSDIEKASSSYLIADGSVRCGDDNNQHQELLSIFWVLFIIWPIMIPLVFVGLLIRVCKSVQSRSITPLAKSCSFLWRDLKEEAMFWEVIDMFRKIFLTGFMLFIDTENGSKKILRLIIATTFSAVYVVILTYARPYQRNDDFCLAIISNILIICCFVLGIIIQQCNSDDEICQDLIGLNLNSYRASVLAVIVTATMIVVTLLLIIILGINADTPTTIKLVSNGEEPNLEMPEDCKFHLFVSHIWATGQDKTHSLVRKLQLSLPGIKIWLDVNNLSDITTLEKSVSEAIVFVLFYTKGYFNSYNCRREINAAVSMGKPTILVHEKYEDIREMRRECEQCFPDNYQQILDFLFSNDVVLWLGRSSLYFAAESTKNLCRRILAHLPYYARHPHLLHNGIKMEPEFGEVILQEDRQLLYCAENERVVDVLNEVKAFASRASSISVTEIDSILTNPSQLKFESQFLILYLNNGIFTDTGGRMEEKVKTAISLNMNIVLIHEQDPDKGGTEEFILIISQTPSELMKMKLYNEIALPLHTFVDYRKISLCHLLCKIGAKPLNEIPKWRAVWVEFCNRRSRLSTTSGQIVRRMRSSLQQHFTRRQSANSYEGVNAVTKQTHNS